MKNRYSKGHSEMDKKKKWMLPLLGFITLLAAGILLVVFLSGSDSLNGEWAVMKDGNIDDTISFEIKSGETLIANYVDSEMNATMRMYQTISQPEKEGNPYTSTTFKKFELRMSKDDFDQAGLEVERFTDEGFQVEEEEQSYLISTENMELVENEFIMAMNEYYLFEIEDTLEVVSMSHSKEEFFVAIPIEKAGQEVQVDYLSKMPFIVSGLVHLEDGRLEQVKNDLAEIKTIQPESKVMELYTQLLALVEDYQRAMENMDEEKLSAITEKISASPVANVGGLYDEYVARNKEYTTYFAQVGIFDEAMAEAEALYSKENMEESLKAIEFDETVISMVESRYPDRFEKYQTLQEKIDKELQSTVTFEDFKGYWATFDEVSYSEIGSNIFYLSDDFTASARVLSEFAIGHIENYTLDGNLLAIDLQPIHGTDPEDFTPYSFNLVLEKTAEGKVLYSPSYPEIIYYNLTDEEYFAHSETDFQQKSQELYEAYLAKAEGVGEMEADPASYILGKVFKEETSDSTVTISFRKKEADSTRPGIGELWYYRETHREDGDVQTRGMQSLIHEITYSDGIFSISTSDYMAMEGDPITVSQYVYLDEHTLGAYDSGTGEILGTLSME